MLLQMTMELLIFLWKLLQFSTFYRRDFLSEASNGTHLVISLMQRVHLRSSILYCKKLSKQQQEICILGNCSKTYYLRSFHLKNASMRYKWKEQSLKLLATEYKNMCHKDKKQLLESNDHVLRIC